MDVNELLAIVKAEALRREGKPQPTVASTTSPTDYPLTANLAPRYLTAMSCRHVRDFLPLYGEEFIDAAFQTILWRKVDDAARDAYLNAILTRGFSKWEILARLRFSVEGRKKGVKVSCLWLACAVSIAYRIPIFGPIFGGLAQLLVLPAYLCRSQRIDAERFAFLRAVGR